MLKSFTLGGQVISVKSVDKIYDKKNKEHIAAMFNPGNGEITVAKNNPELTTDMDDGKGCFLRKSNRNEAICHEIMHAILNNYCEYDLNNSEPFVQKMGMALHQLLKTAKWEQNVKIIEGKLNIS